MIPVGGFPFRPLRIEFARTQTLAGGVLSQRRFGMASFAYQSHVNRSRLAAAVLPARIALALPTWAQINPTNDMAWRAIERRAVEAMIWAMPPVNADLMLTETSIV